MADFLVRRICPLRLGEMPSHWVGHLVVAIFCRTAKMHCTFGSRFVRKCSNHSRTHPSLGIFTSCFGMRNCFGYRAKVPSRSHASGSFLGWLTAHGGSCATRGGRAGWSLVSHAPKERVPSVLTRECRSLVQQVHVRKQGLGGEGQDQHGGVQVRQEDEGAHKGEPVPVP